MTLRHWQITLFLFGSGLCALIYQITWMRELSFVFGATTAASAAVLAIFMGGLGFGSIALGKRANRHKRPLIFYAQLELLITASTAVSPLLIWLVRHIYLALGGSITMGLTLSTVVRLVLSALVLGFPTFLMGGTLPAAAKCAETADDLNRRRMAGIYGANTLGAVTGAMLATFLLLETFGLRMTLWLTCILNFIVAGTAYSLGTNPAFTEGKTPPKPASKTRPEPSSDSTAPPAPKFVYAVAAIVGFVFFLMELVWFRMMSPLFGGTTFTFGFVLAMALLGIGLGGAVYAIFGQNRPASLTALATTCGLEALFLAIPIGLGDNIAVLTAYVRSLEGLGFGGLVFGWGIVLAIVVLPAAVVAGYQFPLLVALLGQGKKNVARHTGMAYAFNTGGAIAGSLAGGFGLIPLLGAVATWRTGVGLLALTALMIFIVARRDNRPVQRLVPALATAGIAFVLLFTTGPTAAWRHSGIGTGRTDVGKTVNQVHGWKNDWRRRIVWEADGRESSIGVYCGNGYSMLNNGGREGDVIGDAATNIFIGLFGAFFHPNPRQVLVIGLATGTTAGWLAQVPDVEQVDVLEMEPATKHAAKLCEDANQHALDNPKVMVIDVDAREYLITAHSRRYDVISSEPSNPYRAGVASLFTQSFYEGVLNSLKADGIFLEFVQSYECDVTTIQTIYRTMASVFPIVETWQTSPDDLLFICSRKPLDLDPTRLRQRLVSEPFKTAALGAMQTADLEGMLAHYVGGKALTDWMVNQHGARINTDDRNSIDYAFARTLGQDYRWHIDDLREIARQLNTHRPQLPADDINWEHVEDQYLGMFVFNGYSPPIPDWLNEAQAHRLNAQLYYFKNQPDNVLSEWQTQEEPPSNPLQLAIIADALAQTGSDVAPQYANELRQGRPLEAAAVMTEWYIQQGKLDSAANTLVGILTQMRTDPWGWPVLMRNTLQLASPLAQADSSLAPMLLAALEQPFAAHFLNIERRFERLSVANQIGLKQTIDALEEYEPNVPWTLNFLSNRAQWYRSTGLDKANEALDDYYEFLDHEPATLGRPANQ